MQSDAKPVMIGEFGEKLIRRTARRLVGRVGFTKSDIDDLEQDLRLQLLKRLPAHDPGKSSLETFTRAEIQYYAKEITRRRARPKRYGCSPVVSLNEEVPDGDGMMVERSDLLTRADDRRLDVRDEIAAGDMALDVGEAVRRLPKEERELCELLSEMSIPEAAKRLGMYEGTLRLRVQKLRRKFRRAGLDAYVENPMRGFKSDANT